MGVLPPHSAGRDVANLVRDHGRPYTILRRSRDDRWLRPDITVMDRRTAIQRADHVFGYPTGDPTVQVIVVEGEISQQLLERDVTGPVVYRRGHGRTIAEGKPSTGR